MCSTESWMNSTCSPSSLWRAAARLPASGSRQITVAPERTRRFDKAPVPAPTSITRSPGSDGNQARERRVHGNEPNRMQEAVQAVRVHNPRADETGRSGILGHHNALLVLTLRAKNDWH